MSIFKKFENGKMFLAGQEVELSAIPWSLHAKFEGVALKHLITAKDTAGEFSYHLVRVAPQKKIGVHIHETQIETHEIIAGYGTCNTMGNELVYKVGNIAVLPAGVEHEVVAGDEGLFIFAKFLPALC